MRFRTRILGFLLLIAPVESFANITLSTNVLTFANQRVGTSSPPQTVTLTFTAPDQPPQPSNTSPGLLAALPGSDMTVSPQEKYDNLDFVLPRAISCTRWNGLQSTCSLDVVFKPLTGGAKKAMLTIRNESAVVAPNSPNCYCLAPVVASVRLIGTTVELPRVGAFAHVASGGGWKTTLTLVNRSSISAGTRITFYSDGGTPLALPGTTSGTIDVTINANSSYIFETELSSSSASSGWADVAASSPLDGYAVFRWRSFGNPDLEGTVALDRVPSSTDLSNSSLSIPFDNTNGFNTAIAVASPAGASSGVSIGIVALDENGTFIGQSFSAVSVPPSGHVSFFLTDLQQSDHGDITAVAGRRGIIQLSPGLSAVGLRFNPSGSFTSIPLIRGSN